jgi:gluconate 5-dehydrogenase
MRHPAALAAACRPCRPNQSNAGFTDSLNLRHAACEPETFSYRSHGFSDILEFLPEQGLQSLFDLSGKIALITGSVAGLGKAMALALARHGATVVLNGRSDEHLQATQQEFSSMGLEAHKARFDVGDLDAAAREIRAINSQLGVIDILINNVGFRDRRPVQEFAIGDMDRMLATNLSAPFELSRLLAPAMMSKSWGRIINVSSVVASIASDGDATYVAAKGGLESLTRALAVEYGRSGVTVNAISPGFFLTDPNLQLAKDEALNKWLASRTILGRWAEPAELAGVAVFLASNSSSYVTGQTIQVDGGMSARL